MGSRVHVWATRQGFFRRRLPGPHLRRAHAGPHGPQGHRPIARLFVRQRGQKTRTWYMLYKKCLEK